MWTFRVRPGFVFSPPSDEPVDATTFAASIERSTAPAFVGSEAVRALADVDGMAAYRRGLTTHLEGVQAAGDRLTIRLRRSVPDLDARLASLFFCAVPKDTPVVPTGLQGPIPSAGPYYIAGASGGAFTVLRRNPHYPALNHAGFDAFVYELNVEQRRALDLIRHGRADYAAFYGHDAASAPVAQLGAAGDALGIQFRLSRPGPSRAGRHGSASANSRPPFGCRSYAARCTRGSTEATLPVRRRAPGSRHRHEPSPAERAPRAAQRADSGARQPLPPLLATSATLRAKGPPPVCLGRRRARGGQRQAEPACASRQK